MSSKKGFKTIDEYIATFPKTTQTVLEALRRAIKEAAPNAEETISYQMPAFKQNGIVVYFAAFKNHIGFFPTASAVEAFKEKLCGYETSKGTVRFPFGEPIPLELVKEMVQFKVKENNAKKK